MLGGEWVGHDIHKGSCSVRCCSEKEANATREIFITKERTAFRVDASKR